MGAQIVRGESYVNVNNLRFIVGISAFDTRFKVS